MQTVNAELTLWCLTDQQEFMRGVAATTKVARRLGEVGERMEELL